MSQKTMYGPCPCGSGKKLKFCCYLKRSEQADAKGLSQLKSNGKNEGVGSDQFAGLDEDVRRETIELCDKGLSLMARAEYEKAVTLFRKAVSLSEGAYSPANNLALGLFVTGKLDEALEIQRQCLETSPFNNPFGCTNLANLEYIKGNEGEAKRRLDQAVKMKLPSLYACVKVCEGLARFKRHQDILDYADAIGFVDYSYVCFYTGVAAANVGDVLRAMQDLSKVDREHPKEERVARYLEHLQAGSSPSSVFGDWPYLDLYEICPVSVMEAEIERVDNPWTARRIAVDVCEGFLNADPNDFTETMDVLLQVKHPAAIQLLWAIVKGDFGPDALRSIALTDLKEREEIDSKDRIMMLQQGEYREISCRTTALNWGFKYGPRLPRKWKRRYEQTVLAGEKENPDWESLAEVYQKVSEAVPDYFPARYNYAITLAHRGRHEEAELILKEILDEYPDYLFAAATLIQILCFQDRVEEAETYVRAMVLPEETHPDAMFAWLMGSGAFYKMIKEHEAADLCFTQAYDINPDNPYFQKMLEEGE